MKEPLDLIIRDGSVVLSNDIRQMDIGISNGRIVQLAKGLTTPAKKTISASGMIVMPGMIDAHVHLNEPGLGAWEGFASGSAALAAGGCTTYIDMPLNGIPPTVTVAALEQKLAAAQGKSVVDYALWGGLVPGHLDDLRALDEAGVIGFKAFMSSPGDPSEDAFREVDDATLLAGMKIIAELGHILALHAESEPIVAALTKEKLAEGAISAADYTASRPVRAELEAVNRALLFAEQTGCALHFVHISSAVAVQTIADAKQRGVNVTLETCPHYLVLTDHDLELIGPAAKCAPPLRSQSEQEQLWAMLAAGHIDMIASDHSPCPSELKQSDNYFTAWGGIAGAQNSLELMIDEGYTKRGVPLPVLSRMLSFAPASRFGLSDTKGEIRIGADADLVMVQLDAPYTLEEQHLYHRHKHNPYIGRKFGCRVMATWSRGNMVYEVKSGIAEPFAGQWLSGAPACAKQEV
ncbi:allantoinase [Paenibacillus sp. FSL H8-0537]|uniref:allantoinase n=1 Tax=Paenibacillus sp. FSL H8-0537 TaxID=2921399 RepID=UPI0031012C24